MVGKNAGNSFKSPERSELGTLIGKTSALSYEDDKQITESAPSHEQSSSNSAKRESKAYVQSAWNARGRKKTALGSTSFFILFKTLTPFRFNTAQFSPVFRATHYHIFFTFCQYSFGCYFVILNL